MVLFFISGLSILIMGVVGYNDCTQSPMTETISCSIVNYLAISLNYLLIPIFLNAFGGMLFYIAIFEFICAQSPHSMKGLLIGTYYAIKGVFQLVGVLVIYIYILLYMYNAFITAWCMPIESTFSSLWFMYYTFSML